MTRIVGGRAGGRRLAVPPGGTRPTAERVREAAFSAVESRLGGLAGRRVLDLYAGSGALGLEAASRGAGRVVLVESDARAARVAKANAERLGLPGVQVVRTPVARFLGAGPGPDVRFDLVLVDPPYDLPVADLRAALQPLADRWLAAGALVVVERSSRDAADPMPAGVGPGQPRRYGETVLWIGSSRDVPAGDAAAGTGGPAPADPVRPS